MILKLQKSNFFDMKFITVFKIPYRFVWTTLFRISCKEEVQAVRKCLDEERSLCFSIMVLWAYVDIKTHHTVEKEQKINTNRSFCCLLTIFFRRRGNVLKTIIDHVEIFTTIMNPKEKVRMAFGYCLLNRALAVIEFSFIFVRFFV